MTFHVSLTSKLIFYYTVLGPFYRSRVFMRINYACRLIAGILPVFCFFCVYTEKDIRSNWTKPPHVGLRLNQQPREPVCLKSGKINIILLKKFLQFIKSIATMSVLSFNFIFGRSWGIGWFKLILQLQAAQC